MAVLLFLRVCHMKPMLLLVSHRLLASNLQHRKKLPFMNTFELSTSISAWVIIQSPANAGFSGSISTVLEPRVSHMADMMANINMRTERDVLPPGYLVLPFLRCPQSFLFLFALHKVTAISGLSDFHSQLFRGRQRRGPLENGNQSVARKSLVTDVSGWLLVSVSASLSCLLHSTTAVQLNNTWMPSCYPGIIHILH